MKKWIVLYDNTSTRGVDGWSGFQAYFSTKRRAIKHAKRRARANPGSTFSVAKVVRAVRR